MKIISSCYSCWLITGLPFYPRTCVMSEKSYFFLLLDEMIDLIPFQRKCIKMTTCFFILEIGKRINNIYICPLPFLVLSSTNQTNLWASAWMLIPFCNHSLAMCLDDSGGIPARITMCACNVYITIRSSVL